MSQPNLHMAAAQPGGDDVWDNVSDEDLVARSQRPVPPVRKTPKAPRN